MIEVSFKTKIISALVVAFIVGGILRVFVIEGFIVSGDSMEPAIHSGDYVFVNKLAYTWDEPERGDVVVLVPRKENIKLLKRVVGLPGEYFDINSGQVMTKQNRTSTSTPLNENYLENENVIETGGVIHTNIDPGEYFALGDNREESIDSRNLGLVDIWDIKGKVFGAISFTEFSYKGF